MVYNLALQYTQNKADAEEITQDVFVKVHQKIHTFGERSELKTWIYRIAINQSLDFLRSKNYFLKNPELIEKQLIDCKKTLEGIKSKSSSSSEAALILNNYLVS